MKAINKRIRRARRDLERALQNWGTAIVARGIQAFRAADAEMAVSGDFGRCLSAVETAIAGHSSREMKILMASRRRLLEVTSLAQKVQFRMLFQKEKEIVKSRLRGMVAL